MITNNNSTNRNSTFAKTAAALMLVTAIFNIIDADRALENLYHSIASPQLGIGVILFAIGGLYLVVGFLLTGMTIFSDSINQYTKTTAAFIVIGYFTIALAELFHSWFFTLPTVIIELAIAVIILMHLLPKYKHRSQKKKTRLLIITGILMIVSIIHAIIFETDVVAQFVGGNLIFMIFEFVALILFEVYMSKRY